MQSLDRAVEYRHATPASDIPWRGADKKRSQPVTKRQRMFVEDCLTSDDTFEKVMKKHFITSERFDKWLRNPEFRKYLKGIRRSLGMQRDMIISIGSVRGREVGGGLKKRRPASTQEDRARTLRCRAADILLQRAWDLEEREIQRRRAAGEPPVAPLAHPDHTEEEVLRLMDIVEGKEPAD